MYSKKVMEHFQNPRNVGEIEDASGVGEVGNPHCGDIMKMWIKVDENDIIVDAKFKTFGCAAAIATSSMATELIKGKHIDEALKLTNQEIAQELDGLPPIKMHCSVLAADALRKAIYDYKGIVTDDQEEEICHCFKIKRKVIEEAVAQGAFSLKQVQEKTKAGTNCGKCVPDILNILNKYAFKKMEKVTQGQEK